MLLVKARIHLIYICCCRRLLLVLILSRCNRLALLRSGAIVGIAAVLWLLCRTHLFPVLMAEGGLCKRKVVHGVVGRIEACTAGASLVLTLLSEI